MRREPEHLANIDRLPEQFEPSLHDLDRRLSELARAQRFPDGLTERCVRASASDLPELVTAKTTTTSNATVTVPRWQPRLVSTQRPRLRAYGLGRAIGWGRLGMAASLAFAVVLAGLLLPRSAPTEVVELATLDIGWLAEDPLDRQDAQVAHILDTWSIHSVDEVRNELGM